MIQTSLTFDWFRNIDGDRAIPRRNLEWTYHYLSSAGLFDAELPHLNSFLDQAGSALNQCGLMDTHHAWAHIYEDLSNWPELEVFFLSSAQSPIIIGFELSRGQKDLLTRAGKTYVDLRTHPVRFLPDYMFAANTNSPEIHTRLCAVAAPRSYIDRHVGFTKARAARRYSNRIDVQNSLVFFGQTAIDASRIQNHEIVEDLFVLSEIERLLETQKVENFYVKHHPHEAMSPFLMDALKRLNAIETNTNTYDLLSTDGVLCASLSSSVCHEAQYFKARSHTFLEPLYTIATIGRDYKLGEYLMMPSNLHSAAFWQFLLHGETMPDPEFPELQTPYKSASGLSWG